MMYKYTCMYMYILLVYERQQEFLDRKRSTKGFFGGIGMLKDVGIFWVDKF